ncbi:hypothetical protein KDA_44540 [Dictyobacter alpinus]|uniref:HDOD domain-containing protein n=1 Tax=Dictyobacter alpinus TaxID=2014873 RepID=A0A402BCE1_9CHLR|nr:hypothetical protein KDA_44540 [Dictyobacter alpinus]
MNSDWRTAPIPEQLRATLGLLEKVTLSPNVLSSEDMLPVLATGVSAQAIQDALLICAGFNIISRLADALDVAIPSAEGFSRSAERLLTHGYH